MRRTVRVLSTVATTGLLMAGLAAVPVSASPVTRPSTPAPPRDYCGKRCHDILPPGENGNATLVDVLGNQVAGTRPAHADDQLGPYAALADQYGGLSTETINDFFNDASFGVPDEQVESRITPRADVTITRDKATGVPHISGSTRSGTEIGAGFAAAEDRLWLMDVLRHVGRGQLTSFAGGAEANRELEQQFFAAAPYTEQELQQQIDDTLARSGPRGQQGLADAKSYMDSINDYIAKAHHGRYFPGEYVVTGHVDPITNAGRIEPFTLTDLVVLAAVVGAQFGSGGGGEVQNAIAKLALQERYGAAGGERVWRGLRAEDDPESVHTVHDGQRFPYANTPPDPAGVAMPRPGSVIEQQAVFDATGSAAGDGPRAPIDEESAVDTSGSPGLELARGMFDDRVLPADLLEQNDSMSNALVVSGNHTDDGHPVAVFGPQTGYFAPQLLMLQELQGPGISARGASFAGLSMYVLLGRGQDYAWSATSASQDVTDTYALELCQPDGGKPTTESNFYRFRGDCVPMDTVERTNSWHPTIADGTAPGSYTLRSYRTKYGPVTHRAVVDGKPVGYASLRSSYFHEIDSLVGFQQFNDPAAIRSAEDFRRAAHDVNFTFNWFYADADDTAYVNSGDNPVREPTVDPSMPIKADAGFDWHGWKPEGNAADYTPASQHPNSINQDYYISWNNAQAPGYAAAGTERSSVHRGDLLDRRVRALIDSPAPVTRVNLTQAMAEAGLVDLRAEGVLPELLRVLDSASLSGAAADAVATLQAWLADGGRREQTQPGSQTYAHADAIKIMDAWWPLLVGAEFAGSMGEHAYRAMIDVLAINESPSGFGQEVPGKQVGEPHQGSAYLHGWWGYVHKDIRSVLGDPVRGPLGTAFCGGGDLDRCREVLLDSLNHAVAAPISQVYPGDDTCAAGDQWCADALVHRPLGGITQDTVSTQNRPTYQQVVQFSERRTP